MELRQVEHVVAVVEEGGFTRAAAACHVTQPALSQSVATLERELGCALFHRLGRRVTVTSAGEAFLGPARQILRAADTARAEVAATADLARGRLDLVALPTLAVHPLAEILGRFRVAHPGVAVRVGAPELRSDVLEEVRRGDAELGLTEPPVRLEGLAVRALVPQEILLVSPPGRRRARRIAGHRLAAVELLATPPGTSTRELLEGTCLTAGVEPTIAVETAHRETLVPLVMAGAGSALLPAPQAREAESLGAVVSRLDPVVRRRVGFVHRDAPLSPAARAFLDLTA